MASVILKWRDLLTPLFVASRYGATSHFAMGELDDDLVLIVRGRARHRDRVPQWRSSMRAAQRSVGSVVRSTTVKSGALSTLIGWFQIGLEPPEDDPILATVEQRNQFLSRKNEHRPALVGDLKRSQRSSNQICPVDSVAVK